MAKGHDVTMYGCNLKFPVVSIRNIHMLSPCTKSSKSQLNTTSEYIFEILCDINGQYYCIYAQESKCYEVGTYWNLPSE